MMATYSTEPQKRYMFAGEVLSTGNGCTRRLRSGVLLTGVPTVTTTAGLTVSGVGLNAAAVVLNGESHAINAAVMFTLTAVTIGNYDVTITAATTDGQTLKDVLAIEVK